MIRMTEPAPSHDSSTPSPPTDNLLLPDLQEAILDEEQLRSYLTDVTRLAEDLTVAIKQSARMRPRTRRSVGGLVKQLLSGEAFGAQLRYRYASAGWLDTLISGPKGVKLVRMQV